MFPGYKMNQIKKLQDSLFKRIILETKQYDIMKHGIDVGFYTQIELVKQHTKLKAMVKKWEKLEKQLKGEN